MIGKQLFVSPALKARRQAVNWQHFKPREADLLFKISEQPHAIWLNNYQDLDQFRRGTLNDIINSNTSPVIVAYNIPRRDASGSYSAGGEDNVTNYLSWIEDLCSAIVDLDAIV